MESIFLILSGVILFAGVIYWMWSHLQLTQKKVQLLENAVFELRAMIPGGGTAGPPPSISVTMPAAAAAAGATAPSPSKNTAYADLADDDWEVQASVEPVPEKSTPLDLDAPAASGSVPQLVTHDFDMPDGAQLNDDLMPGGRASGVPTEEESETAESELTEQKFKSLFASRIVPEPTGAGSSSAAAAATTPSATALEGMPLKQLRQLGEQRGIKGASEMRKKELLNMLRSQVAPPSSAPATTASLDLETMVPASTAEEIVTPAEEEAEILE